MKMGHGVGSASGSCCGFIVSGSGTPRHMMLEKGAHSNWAKNARRLANGEKSRYD